MPYSVKTSLTIGQVVARLTKPDADYDGRCDLRNGPTLEGPGGTTQVRYLYREHSRKRYVAPLPGYPDDTLLAPSMVRTICAQLGLRPDILGVLGDPNDPMDPLYGDDDDDEQPSG